MQVRMIAIIPAYNEAGSIGGVIAGIRRHQPDMDILVINDGSTDSTSAVARATGCAHVIDLPVNLGIGGAVQTGYLYAHRHGYDIAVQIDGDGQHDPGELEKIIAPVREGRAECCIGTRFGENQGYRSTAARRAGIHYFTWMIRSTTRHRLTDPTSGFRALGRRGISSFAAYYPDDYPEVEAIVVLLRQGFTVLETPVLMHTRAAGCSSITPLKSMYYMIKVSLAVVMARLREAEKAR
ncbi:MAG: glycosyl transferase family protein [Paenibacillaceae bacterium]|jgi:glycosyltransferase involved in cell wall biosynthesis|nr:glycosyl transferase family protein [Paenibacillaceae bacterium]